MSDALRRGIRTLMWGILAAAGAFAPVAEAFNLSPGLVGKIMATFAFIVAILTAIVNSLEDNVDWFPALLKKPANEGADPVPDDAGGQRGESVVNVLVVVFIVLIVVFIIQKLF